MTISVLLVDDHTVFVETLAVALASKDGIVVAGTATTAAGGLEAAAETRPDVALVDVELPDFGGIELTRRLRFTAPSTRVIILTASSDASIFAQAMDAGACGYLVKDTALSELTESIRSAYAGQVVVPDAVIGKLLAFRPPSSGVGSDLTRRELEVLALLGEGCDMRSISKSLGITWHTARSYVKAVLTKLGAHSQLEAVAAAMRLGILSSRSDVRL